jgi:D-3-phosphoglycerate dehydrogenase / 2-oxoglutarate reductase
MKILFIDTVHPILWDRLKAHNFKCIDITNLTGDELLNSIYTAHGLVIRSKITLDKTVLEKCENLKFIARSGSGLENIDVEFANAKGVKIFNSPEGNRTAVAEHVIGMLLSLFNNLKQGDEEVKQGIWRREENRGIEIEGKTIGIIGYGNTGMALAKRLSSFDCNILAYDKYKTNFGSATVKEVSLNEIQGEADIISFHVPYNPETYYYFDDSFLNSVKKKFFLVNTSRGKVVDTKAVIDGLKSKKILGACIDVLEFESSSFEKINPGFKKSLNFLRNQENVILSPHVAGWTVESYFKLSNVLADKILAQLSASKA